MQVIEQVAPNIQQNLLGGLDHDLCIAVCTQRPCQIDCCGDGDTENQLFDIPGGEIVDNRADHICTEQIAGRADRDQNGNGQQQKFVPSHVPEEGEAVNFKFLGRLPLIGRAI